jgi:hypothetical protein
LPQKLDTPGLKIIHKHTKQSNKEEINPKLNALKKNLSQDESTEIGIAADKWSPKQTKITLRAYRGIKETLELIDKK